MVRAGHNYLKLRHGADDICECDRLSFVLNGAALFLLFVGGVLLSTNPARLA